MRSFTFSCNAKQRMLEIWQQWFECLSYVQNLINASLIPSGHLFQMWSSSLQGRDVSLMTMWRIWESCWPWPLATKSLNFWANLDFCIKFIKQIPQNILSYCPHRNRTDERTDGLINKTALASGCRWRGDITRRKDVRVWKELCFLILSSHSFALESRNHDVFNAISS